MGMPSYELRDKMRGAGLFGWQRQRPRAGMPAARAKRERSAVINCERDALLAGPLKTNQRRTKFCAGELLHIGNFAALAAYPHMWSKCWWKACIGVSMWISTEAGAAAGASSCPWPQAGAGGAGGAP